MTKRISAWLTGSLAVFAAISWLICPLKVRAADSDSAKLAIDIEEMIKKAKTIVVGCKLYALDHNGLFPPNLTKLVGDYLPKPASLVCALCPDEPVGFDYFIVPPEGPKKMVIRSKAKTKDGKWLIVYNNDEAELTTEKEPKEE
jgi:hypothetical protein